MGSSSSKPGSEGGSGRVCAFVQEAVVDCRLAVGRRGRNCGFLTDRVLLDESNVRSIGDCNPCPRSVYSDTVDRTPQLIRPDLVASIDLYSVNRVL